MKLRMLAAAVSAALCAACGSALAHDRHDDDRGRGSGHGESAATIQARQKFFGVENVDRRGRVKKDKVIFSWATNTTYAVALKGRVVLLDSYIAHAELPASLPPNAPERYLVVDITNGYAPGPLRVHLYDLGAEGYRIAGIERPTALKRPD